MYFFACIVNTFNQAFTDLQTVSFAQKANIFIFILLVSKCSWLFPNRSILMIFSSHLFG